jgi:hypothetical protein
LVKIRAFDPHAQVALGSETGGGPTGTRPIKLKDGRRFTPWVVLMDAAEQGGSIEVAIA